MLGGRREADRRFRPQSPGEAEAGAPPPPTTCRTAAHDLGSRAAGPDDSSLGGGGGTSGTSAGMHGLHRHGTEGADLFPTTAHVDSREGSSTRRRSHPERPVGGPTDSPLPRRASDGCSSY